MVEEMVEEEAREEAAKNNFYAFAAKRIGIRTTAKKTSKPGEKSTTTAMAATTGSPW